MLSICMFIVLLYLNHCKHDCVLFTARRDDDDDDEQENYASQSVAAIIMMVFQYSEDPGVSLWLAIITHESPYHQFSVLGFWSANK